MPDPVRQEFMNVGVIVAPDDAAPLVHIVNKDHLRRAKALGLMADDFGSITSIAEQVAQWGPDGASQLAAASREWGGTVRISDVRGALHDNAKVLLDQLFDLHVTPAVTSGRQPVRDRRVARRLVRERLQAVLPGEAVTLAPTVPGKVESHEFDAGIQNGQLLHAVAALSFEIKTPKLLEADINSCAWAISDVRESNSTLPISVIALGNTQSKMLQRAHSLYGALGANVVDERDVAAWADDVGVSVRKKLASH